MWGNGLLRCSVGLFNWIRLLDDLLVFCVNFYCVVFLSLGHDMSQIIEKVFFDLDICHQVDEDLLKL